MRTALLIGFIHGDDAPRIFGSGNPSECNAAFKQAALAPGPLRELQLWESGAGVTKRKRFEATKEAVAHANAGFKKAALINAERDVLLEKLEVLEAENAMLREAAPPKPAAPPSGKKQVP
jgi:hypothetical protein